MDIRRMIKKRKEVRLAISGNSYDAISAQKTSVAVLGPATAGLGIDRVSSTSVGKSFAKFGIDQLATESPSISRLAV